MNTSQKPIELINNYYLEDISEKVWVFIICLTFFYIAFCIRGPDYRSDIDYASDITLLRFLAGDTLSLFVINHSPVIDYSIPYGGWPPLNMLIQAVWLSIGIPMGYARLLTGIISAIMFAICVILILKQLNQKYDLPLVLMMSMMHPIIMKNLGIGISHILIPFGAALALLLFIYSYSRKISFLSIFYSLVGGFMLGVTDWHTYTVVPAIVIIIIMRKKLNIYISDEQKRLIFTNTCFLTIGLISAFLTVKFFQLNSIQNGLALGTTGGITLGKLFLRISHGPKEIVFGLFYSVIRFIIAIVPLLIIIFITRYTKSGRFGFTNKTKLIFYTALACPIIFITVFTEQVSIPAHHFEALAFLCPVSLMSGIIVIEKNKNYIRLLTFTGLFLYSIYAVSGYKWLPQQMLFWDTGYTMEAPLAPGNYVFKMEKPKANMHKLMKTINNQIISFPIDQGRLTEINKSNKAQSNFRIYGEEFGKYCNKNDIIIVFGPGHISYNYYTQRIVMSISNLPQLLTIIENLKKLNFAGRIAILAPEGSAREATEYINRNVQVKNVEVKKAGASPYEFVYCKF